MVQKMKVHYHRTIHAFSIMITITTKLVNFVWMDIDTLHLHMQMHIL